MLILCCDGLKGFPEAIEAVFPKATVQTCIVHMIRNSLRFVTWKDRKAPAAALRPIYSAQTDVLAEAALSAFEASAFGLRYARIGKSRRGNWERVIPFLAFPREIRKVIYTTNAIESLNYSLRKIIKTRGHFPSEEAATKLLYLALVRAEQRWTRPLGEWKNALNQFAVHFEALCTICLPIESSRCRCASPRRTGPEPKSLARPADSFRPRRGPTRLRSPLRPEIR